MALFKAAMPRPVMIPNETALSAHLNGGVPTGPGVGGF